MSNGTSNSDAWQHYDETTRLSLCIGETDRLTYQNKVLADETDTRLSKMETRLAWILGIFVTILATVLGGLTLALLTLK